MKLVMFQPKSGDNKGLRAGVLLPKGEILSLQKAAAILGLDSEGGSLKSVRSMLCDWPTNFGIAKHILEEAAGGGAAKLEKACIVPDSVKLLPPLSSPGKFICPGLNFSEHISESKDSVGQRPPMPIAFVKFPTAIIGPEEPLVLPWWVEHVDYEVEVAAAISRKGKRVDRSEALSYVAGYMILNDVSARAVQFEEMKMGMLLLGKNFDGFAPLGPWLVTADEVPDPQELEMELWIEGEDSARQKSNTRNMIFGFAELIEHWSQMTLHPGDVISSGTPSGVAAFRKPDPEPWYLRPGQTMIAKVGKLGELRTPVVSSEETF